MSNDIYARLRELAASAEARPAVMRPVLLRVITDLFILHPQHTPQEIRLFEEMAGELAHDADESTLSIVARKLTQAADAPESVLRRIFERGGAPAQEILSCDTRIDWRELRQIAASGAGGAASAIARRSDLDRELTKILSQRPERDVALALAANSLAPLAVDDRRQLIARGRDDGALARALLDRGDLTLDHLPLYLDADDSERALLIRLTRNSSLGQIGRQVGRNESAAPLDDPLCLRLESSALRMKRASFALTLAEILDCDPNCARRIVDDESGDAMTLTFIAIGLPQEICARIFLMAFPKIALSHETFDRNLSLVASLPRRDALRIVAAITGLSRSVAAASMRAQARRAPLGGMVGAQTLRPAGLDEQLRDVAEG